MGAHDKYGKKVMTAAFGTDFDPKPKSEYITHDGRKAGSINIDGVLFQNISVEIESRVNKQVRGAVLDLILHPGKLKLLVLIVAHGNDYTELQAKSILSKFCVPRSWKVVTLNGSGDRPDDFIQSDVKVLQSAADELRREQE